MTISPEKKPGTTLFHTIDKQFKSDTIVNFEFHPENASEAHNLIARLVPFLKDTGHMYHLKMFNPEALNRQAKANGMLPLGKQIRKLTWSYQISLQKMMT